MIKINTNSYYALVREEDLKSGFNAVISGELITPDTELPISGLIGTNKNDIYREVWQQRIEVKKYDKTRFRESYDYYIKENEWVRPRNVRLVVWEGKANLELPYDKYRVITVEAFEAMKRGIKVQEGVEDLENDFMRAEVLEEENSGRKKKYNSCRKTSGARVLRK